MHVSMPAPPICGMKPTRRRKRAEGDVELTRTDAAMTTTVTQGEEERRSYGATKGKRRKGGNGAPEPPGSVVATTTSDGAASRRRSDVDRRYLHGNYVGYCRRRATTRTTGGGSETSGDEEDERLALFRREWFENRRVVDLGCNDGAVTVEVARRFAPTAAVGVDLDEKLIQKARRATRNEARRASDVESQRRSSSAADPTKSSAPIASPAATADREWIPLSFQFERRRKEVRTTASTSSPPAAASPTTTFPFNLRFVCEDFTTEDAGTVLAEENAWDAVLLLSVTKWVHLHGGDKAIKKLFRRVYRAIRPGGVLILEPQPFHSYKRKLHLHPDLKQNYQRIRLEPDQFPRHLVEKVGFASVETLRERRPKGNVFNREIFLLRKGHAPSRPLPSLKAT